MSCMEELHVFRPLPLNGRTEQVIYSPSHTINPARSEFLATSLGRVFKTQLWTRSQLVTL
jgi:hypothetical protein